MVKGEYPQKTLLLLNPIRVIILLKVCIKSRLPNNLLRNQDHRQPNHAFDNYLCKLDARSHNDLQQRTR